MTPPTALPPPPPPPPPRLSPDADIRLCHVDADLVALDKPSGLLSVPGRGADKADCAWSRLQRLHPEALVVHRLDMGTSGLLLFARHLAAQQALGRAFEQRQVHKGYEAVVAGLVASDAGEIDLPLSCDWPNRPRQQVDPGPRGKPALTRWQVLGRDPAAGTTRLLLCPQTGRSHQLRVHLQALGHPILGDELYAPEAWARAAPRLCLHARDLALPHPTGGAPLRLHAPTPF